MNGAQAVLESLKKENVDIVFGYPGGAVLDLYDEIYKIIWDKVKENNKKLTSYKAVRKIEIKKDEFEKTTTMKIKRFAEINKDNAKK